MHAKKHPQRITLAHIPSKNTPMTNVPVINCKKMRVKLPQTQVAWHGAAGAFIPLTHVKSPLRSFFRKTNVFYYWQLLIILFADDRRKKLWHYTSL